MHVVLNNAIVPLTLPSMHVGNNPQEDETLLPTGKASFFGWKKTHGITSGS